MRYGLQHGLGQDGGLDDAGADSGVATRVLPETPA